MKLLIPPPAQGLITGLAMWGVARLLPQFATTFSGQSLLSYILIGLGLSIELIAIGAFFRARTTITPLKPDKASSLVIGGLYKISRNPMYLGLAILLTGWALRLGNPLNALLLISFIVYMTNFQIKPEEVILQEKFGEDYADYTKKVRRWI